MKVNGKSVSLSMKLGKAGEAYFLERKKHIYMESQYTRRQSGNSYETSPTVTMDEEGSYKSLAASKSHALPESDVDKKQVVSNQSTAAAVGNNISPAREVLEQESSLNTSRYICKYIPSITYFF